MQYVMINASTNKIAVTQPHLIAYLIHEFRPAFNSEINTIDF